MIVGAVQRPAEGETACGDVYQLIGDPPKLIACADGLGHGPDAQVAARCFCDFAASHSEEPLQEIFAGAHRALRPTRGAAACLLRVDQGARQITYAGVGSMDLRAHSRDRFAPVATPGIVGRYSLKKVHVTRQVYSPADLIVLFSDGVSARFDLTSLCQLEPEALAQSLIDDFGRSHDDATCIAIRL